MEAPILAEKVEQNLRWVSCITPKVGEEALMSYYLKKYGKISEGWVDCVMPKFLFLFNTPFHGNKMNRTKKDVRPHITP